ncbi:hypothetical protein [Cytobacillus pseudoceanisediminis]
MILLKDSLNNISQNSYYTNLPLLLNKKKKPGSAADLEYKHLLA